MTRRAAILARIAQARANRRVLGGFSAYHLGDILCISPLPRLLAEHRGMRVHITRHPNTLAVFANNPYILGFARGSTISPEASATGHGHVLQRILQGLELPIDPIPKPEIYLTVEEQAWAVQERNKWPQNKPICILSCRALSDRSNVDKVDWVQVAKVISRRFTVVQPIIDEPTIAGAISYRGLTLRQYMSLFKVVDCFMGGTSGGTHIARAFDVPSIVVIWRSLHQILQFPISGQGFKASFLYPQHWFISSEDICPTQFIESALEQLIDEVLHYGRVGRPTSIGNHPQTPLGFKPRFPARLLRLSNHRLIRVPTL
jgi:hypothetical protein